MSDECGDHSKYLLIGSGKRNIEIELVTIIMKGLIPGEGTEKHIS